MPPHYGKFIAYFRVSTDRQGKSGLGLAAQREAVMSYLDGGRWALVDEFTEVESGKRNDRPELEKALAACKKQKSDNPHANKLTVHILAAVAQHEREIISARTSAALKAAKARGKRLGNPKLSEARRHATAARKDKADRYSANVLPVIREIQRSGIKSLRGIARALAARGIPAAHGRPSRSLTFCVELEISLPGKAPRRPPYEPANNSERLPRANALLPGSKGGKVGLPGDHSSTVSACCS
jgi:DNA invertase Pin-like site-specific DNA recombinase